MDMENVRQFIFDELTSREEMSQIWEWLKIREGQLRMRAAGAFSVGDKVEFDHNTQGHVTGVVTKVNPKSIRVDADDGGRWKCSPTLIHKI